MGNTLTARGFFAWLFLLPFMTAAAQSEVVDSASNGFTVQHTVQIERSPEYVYNVLVEGVGKWWSSDHTFSRDASNLSIDARPNGCFCERLGDGAGVRHQTVVYASPGKRLRMVGGLGPLQTSGVSGSLSIDLSESGSGTRLQLNYSVGGYHPGGLDKWAQPVDSVLVEQMERLKRYAETGSADEKP